MLSIVAARHGVPFFIAAPTTTLDAALPDGSAIEIEQRPAEEVTHFRGHRVVTDKIKVGRRGEHERTPSRQDLACCPNC